MSTWVDVALLALLVLVNTASPGAIWRWSPCAKASCNVSPSAAAVAGNSHASPTNRTSSSRRSRSASPWPAPRVDHRRRVARRTVRLAARLSRRGPPPVVVIVVTLVLTYVTLVVGELAPKRIAMQNRAERWGLVTARTALVPHQHHPARRLAPGPTDERRRPIRRWRPRTAARRRDRRGDPRHRRDGSPVHHSNNDHRRRDRNRRADAARRPGPATRRLRATDRRSAATARAARRVRPRPAPVAAPTSTSSSVSSIYVELVPTVAPPRTCRPASPA